LVKNGLRGIASHRKSTGVNRQNCGKFISILVARLIRNPILKVLSSIQPHRVQALLMGGQACVFYGTAEFSLLAKLRRSTLLDTSQERTRKPQPRSHITQLAFDGIIAPPRVDQ